MPKSVSPHTVRVRVGDGKATGQRGMMRLPASLSAEVAASRKLRLEAMAATLRPLGLPGDSLAWLRKACRQESAAAFTVMEKLVARFVREQSQKQTKAVGLHDKTFRELADDWTSGRLAKKHPDYIGLKASSADDAQRLGVICNTIGHIAIRKLTIEDIERACLPSNLPKAVKSGNTRRQYKQAIKTLIGYAVAPVGLITEKDNPIPRKNFLPKKQKAPIYTFLFPTEDLQLMRCATVPIMMRLLYGFLVREGQRVDHVLRMTWRDVDAVNNIMVTGRTKTDPGHDWIADPGTIRAFVLMRGDAGDDDLIFPGISASDQIELATTFRAHLWEAGCRRDAIHHAKEGHGMLRLHDLRASHVTIALALGRSNHDVKARTGHKSDQTLALYSRKVSIARKLALTDWTPLDEALGLSRPAVKIADESSPADVSAELPDRGGVGSRVGSVSVLVPNSLIITGGSSGIRTHDQRIKSPVRGKSGKHETTKTPVKAASSYPETPSCPPSDGGVGSAVDAEAVLLRSMDQAAKDGRYDFAAECLAELRERRRKRDAPGLSSLDEQRAKRGGK